MKAAQPHASEVLPNGQVMPEGGDFLEAVSEMERACEKATHEWLSRSGTKAPECYTALGTVMSLLDRLASCGWGCSKGDHAVEYLAARALHNARAGVLLLRRGFYDEGLVMARSAGEVANLTLLFCLDPEALPIWKRLPQKERWTQFKPVKVRERLEGLGGPSVLDEERYGLLNEFGVHPSPERVPNRFNPMGRPRGPGYFQELGAFTVLNEISLALVWAGAAVASLVEIPADQATAIFSACVALDESVGGLQVVRLKDAQAEIRAASSLSLEGVGNGRHPDAFPEGARS